MTTEFRSTARKVAISKLAMLTGLFMVVFGAEVHSASYTGEYEIYQVGTDATKFAGCLVRIRATSTQLDPSDAFSGCQAQFVTLGCDGTLGITKSQANANFAQAQLAFVAQRKAILRFYDTSAPQSPEGYCLADRVDVRGPL